MSEIPEDIMEAARSVRFDYVGEATGALRPWPRLDELIGRAILAERERCANAAWDFYYGEKRGRVTPEEFAEFLQRNPKP